MPQRMPKQLFLLFLLAPAVFSLPAQVGSHAQSAVRLVDGAGIFQHHCAACHGVDGRGGGPAAAALKQKVPDLTRLSQSNGGNFPVLHVATTILLGSDDLIPAHGSTEMPIWGPTFHEIEFDQDLGRVRLDNVTKYLESIQRK